MSNQSQPSRDVTGFSKSEIRIDQPHGIIRGGAHRTSEIGAPQLVGAAVGAHENEVGSSVDHSLEQLREHAAQLADRLQSEQSELDRRQGALASQEADLEAKWQNARQWLTERQQELEENQRRGRQTPQHRRCSGPSFRHREYRKNDQDT